MSEKSDALAVPIDVTMRRPTLFGIPAMPILAAPLVVRRAQVEEAGALAALLGRAFEAESWDAAGTERELFCDERRRLANSALRPTGPGTSRASGLRVRQARRCLLIQLQRPNLEGVLALSLQPAGTGAPPNHCMQPTMAAGGALREDCLPVKWPQ